MSVLFTFQNYIILLKSFAAIFAWPSGQALYLLSSQRTVFHKLTAQCNQLRLCEPVRGVESLGNPLNEDIMY